MMMMMMMILEAGSRRLEQDDDDDDDDNDDNDDDDDDDVGGREAAPGARAEYRQLPARVSSLRSSRIFLYFSNLYFVFRYFYTNIYL